LAKLFFALSVLSFIVFAFRVNVRIYSTLSGNSLQRSDSIAKALFDRKLSGHWLIDLICAAASFGLAMWIAVTMGGFPPLR